MVMRDEDDLSQPCTLKCRQKKVVMKLADADDFAIGAQLPIKFLILRRQVANCEPEGLHGNLKERVRYHDI